MIYQVIDQEVVVFAVAVDKREREQAYRKAAERVVGKRHNGQTAKGRVLVALEVFVAMQRDEMRHQESKINVSICF